LKSREEDYREKMATAGISAILLSCWERPEGTSQKAMFGQGFVTPEPTCPS